MLLGINMFKLICSVRLYISMFIVRFHVRSSLRLNINLCSLRNARSRPMFDIIKEYKPIPNRSIKVLKQKLIAWLYDSNKCGAL